MLAAGGTGGHLFPAIALAAALSERGWRTHLVTDRRGAQHVRTESRLSCSVLPAAGVAGRGLWASATALPVLGLGVIGAIRLLHRRRPAVVVGFGGYASVPAGIAARIRRVPLVLHEANAVLGRANRMLASRAHTLATTFRRVANVPDRVRAKQVGLPVREGFERLLPAGYQPPSESGPIRIVVTGGSQGARALGTIVPAALAAISAETRSRLDVLQQARQEMHEEVRAAYRAAGIRASVLSFIEDMAGALSSAHLVIGRAGAATVTENSVAGRPAIYIPLPSSIDGHQQANAAAAVAVEAAWVMPESDGAEGLADLVSQLLGSRERLAAAALRAPQVVPADAAAKLADLVECAVRGSP